MRFDALKDWKPPFRAFEYDGTWYLADGEDTEENCTRLAYEPEEGRGDKEAVEIIAKALNEYFERHAVINGNKEQQ